MSKRLLLVAVVVVGAALLAAGCGSDDSSSDATPTSEWADDLCSSVSAWKASLTAIVDTLKGGDLSKDALTSAVDDARSATDTFTSDLADLGRPDTEAGQAAMDTIDQLSTEIKADMEKIEDTVNDASGVAGILAAVPVIGSTLSTAGDQVAAAFSSLEDLDAKGELETAFTDASSCSELTGGS